MQRLQKILNTKGGEASIVDAKVGGGASGNDDGDESTNAATAGNAVKADNAASKVPPKRKIVPPTNFTSERARVPPHGQGGGSGVVASTSHKPKGASPSRSLSPVDPPMHRPELVASNSLGSTAESVSSVQSEEDLAVLRSARRLSPAPALAPAVNPDDRAITDSVSSGDLAALPLRPSASSSEPVVPTKSEEQKRVRPVSGIRRSGSSSIDGAPSKLSFRDKDAGASRRPLTGDRSDMSINTNTGGSSVSSSIPLPSVRRSIDGDLNTGSKGNVHASANSGRDTGTETGPVTSVFDRLYIGGGRYNERSSPRDSAVENSAECLPPPPPPGSGPPSASASVGNSPRASSPIQRPVHYPTAAATANKAAIETVKATAIAMAPQQLRKPQQSSRVAAPQLSREPAPTPAPTPAPAPAPAPVLVPVQAVDMAPCAEQLAPEDMAIRVVVRKRPLSRQELNTGEKDVMEVQANATEILIHEPKTRVDLTKVIETSSFTFDGAFHEVADNQSIYTRTVSPLVDFAFEGGKGSCFAYGQTGSGKTYTLLGADPENPVEEGPNAGLYVLAAKDLFKMLRKPEYESLELRLSCFEIYSAKLFDLLNERNVVKCLEDARGNVCTPGLAEEVITDVPQLLNAMSTAHAHRSVGCTGANEASSRSHLIMHLVLKYTKATPSTGVKAPKSGERRRSSFRDLSKGTEGSEEHSRVHGKLTFIDLAGSERGADTSNNSKTTRLEGAEINTSLLALKEVIRALANRALHKQGIWAPKQSHTPFRGSKLTQVLKDSLVGDMARTCMIACVSPAHSNCEHSLNTLRYADRVKEHQSGIDASDAEGGSACTGRAGEEGRPRRRSLGSDPNNSPARHGSNRDLSPYGGERRPTTASGAGGGSVLASPVRVTRPSTSAGGGMRAGTNAGRRQSAVPAFPSNNNNGSSHSNSNSNSNSNSGAPRIGGRNGSMSPLRRPTTSSGIACVEAHAKQNNAANPNPDEKVARAMALLSAHKRSIADTVDSMKIEMELVQAMEDNDDRDLEHYMSSLEVMLDSKEEAVSSLQKELKGFQHYRKRVNN